LHPPQCFTKTIKMPCNIHWQTSHHYTKSNFRYLQINPIKYITVYYSKCNEHFYILTFSSNYTTHSMPRATIYSDQNGYEMFALRGHGWKIQETHCHGNLYQYLGKDWCVSCWRDTELMSPYPRFSFSNTAQSHELSKSTHTLLGKGMLA
jgi:hypothetical protein